MGPLVMAQRERISKKRVTGQLVQWKGKYGWIKPSEPIQHPDALKRSGKVYVGVEDLEGPELATKDMVTFFVYVDGDGLGAMHCRAAAGVVRPDKGGGKGKEQGKAQGKDRRQPAEETPGEEVERTPPPPPDQSARERVLPERITGKLVRWRGQMGWIKPSQKIEHPEVAKHRKGIYLHEVDVQPGQELVQGAEVSFLVYSDPDGLGAEDCVLISPPEEGEGQGADAMEVEAESGSKAQSKGRSKGAIVDAARKKGAAQKGMAPKGTALKGIAPKGMAQKGLVQKVQMKKRRGGKGTKRSQGPGDGTKSRGGPDLPRERVTTTPVTGEVLEWKGTFGWLSCSEELEHEMLPKHEGKIYLHEKDILDGAPLTVGQAVEFHVYSDESGLGAEEAIATAS